MTFGAVQWDHEFALEHERCLLAAELQRRALGGIPSFARETARVGRIGDLSQLAIAAAERTIRGSPDEVEELTKEAA